MTTDTSERCLERLTCTALTGDLCDVPRDYDREDYVDLVQLSAFVRETQREVVDALTRLLDRVDDSNPADEFHLDTEEDEPAADETVGTEEGLGV